MGRVQTPTLGFIVEKELERDNHVPKEYHSVSVPSNGIEMNVRFHESDDPDVIRWMMMENIIQIEPQILDSRNKLLNR